MLRQPGQPTSGCEGERQDTKQCNTNECQIFECCQYLNVQIDNTVMEPRSGIYKIDSTVDGRVSYSHMSADSKLFSVKNKVL